ncbi:MAG TPA: redox-regulated ATPase YchF [Bacteroidales bacterium]|nr:redox-regulated ATPase YchF [Bacteroidales bacterium]HSA43347.1 redox-regulated ATPase YchF [Bacteroidales bacterium]
MSLKCGIVGLTNSGKTTLFNCMSSTKAQAARFAYSATKSNLGVVDVPDPRLAAIDALIRSAKVVPTTVEIVDIPGLAKGASQGEGIGNKFLADIRNTDAIIHVIRCFDDDSLPHVEGSINPVRDREIVDLELQIADLESVDRRLQRLEKAAKVGGDKDARRAVDILHVYKTHLESFQSARTVPLSQEEQRAIQDLFLLTAKPVIYVCNVDEMSAVTGNAYVDQFKAAMKDENTEILVIAGAMEAEISELDSIEDRLVFLNEMGLTEPGVDKLIRAAYHMLSLKTFFTAGPKEVRAWTIREGATAPMAAGVIHSDLERGFIRAEVMKYDDFIRLGSEHACKEAGKLMIEGKNYIVQDGDILHIRFNV